MKEKNYLIRLTVALYRVTDLFPEKEPLRCAIRNAGNRVLADIVLLNENPIKLKVKDKQEITNEGLKNIEILEAYFKVAAEQDWADSRNFSVLSREYNEVKEEVEDDRDEEEEEEPSFAGKTGLPASEAGSAEGREDGRKPTMSAIKEKKDISLLGSSARLQEILKLIHRKGKIQVQEIKDYFPILNKRTIRRYLKVLVKEGTVKKTGESNKTFYQLKK